MNASWISPPLVAGQPGTVQNSQCSVDAANSSVTPSGLTWTAVLAITFKQSFSGPHNISIQNQDAGGSYPPPVPVGTYTVAFPPTGDFSLSVSPTSQPGLLGGTAVYTVSAPPSNGFNGTVSLTISGLPAGVSGTFNPASISGSQTSQLTLSIGPAVATGPATFTVTGTSGSLSRPGSASVTITSPVTILTNPNLPAGSINQAYSQSLTATGGQPPYTWLVASDTPFPLPKGLILNAATGVLSTNGGVLQASGSFYFKLRVNDSSGAANSIVYQYFAMVINGSPGPLMITSASPLPNGTVGAAYAFGFGASGGSGFYSWSVTGSLPPGLTFAGATLEGTPTAAGTYSFTVQLTDGQGTSISKNFSVTISGSSGPLTITTGSPLPGGTTSIAYAQAFVATGGTAPYNWSLTSGNLPPGLTLNGGELSGIPITVGTYNFTIRVTDSASNSVSASYSMTISLHLTPVTITTSSPLQTGTVGVPLTRPLSAAGGQQPYTWSATGAIPPGLTLSNGSLSGTPTTGGNYTLTVKVADSANQSFNRNFDVTIQSASPLPLSATPASETVPPAMPATYTVVMASGGPSGTATLNATGLPTGAVASFSPPTLSGAGMSSLTVTTTGSTPVGTYLISVIAQGAVTYSTQISLVVVPASAATMLAPSPGAALLGTTVTFAWDAGMGVSQYQLNVGSFIGGSDYYSGTNTSQSATVTLPRVSQPQTIYVSLGSMIGGAWQWQNYTYTAGIASSAAGPPSGVRQLFQGQSNSVLNSQQTSPPPLPLPSDFYILNDGSEKTLPYQITNGFAIQVEDSSLMISGFGVSARITHPSSFAPDDDSAFDITFSASPFAPAGHRDLCLIYDYVNTTYSGAGNFTDPDPEPIPLCLQDGLDVWDATPVVTSVERYEGPPGDNLFTQGEGIVSVRIKGNNFGPNRYKDPTRLTVSGDSGGVTRQSIVWWSPDGTEIDAYFNIESTASGNYTVTVTSNGADETGFQSGGQPPSQNSGSGLILVLAACPTSINVPSATQRPPNRGDKNRGADPMKINHPLSSAGLKVVGPTSPDFELEVRKLLTDEAFAKASSFLSRSLVIVNDTPHYIWGFTVIYTYPDWIAPSGKPWRHIISPSANSDERQQMMAPGDSYLITPVSSFVARLKGGHRSLGPLLDDGLDRMISLYETQNSQYRIEASIDSVVFADGTLVGPDAAGRVEIINSRVRAEKELVQALKRLRGEELRRALEAESAITGGDDYSLQRSLIAGHIFAILMNQGESEAITAINGIATKKHFENSEFARRQEQ